VTAISTIRDSLLIGEKHITKTAAMQSPRRTSGPQFIMRLIALAALLAGFAGVSGLQNAAAQSTPASGSVPAVVELFTSQGCSSCPAADALLGRLANRGDIIALSLSVDYWDYLGWKDTLASPKFTERQRAYAHARADGAIYTPQAVVNGVAHVNGSEESQITRAIEKTGKTISVARVPIRLSEDKGKLTIDVPAAAPGSSAKEATLWLAVVAKAVEVPVRRGENQGKVITYHNVVRELTPVGMWSGKAMNVQLARHTFMRPGTDRCAVLLQQGSGGPIIGAAMLKDF
jgi:hypothetical protein